MLIVGPGVGGCDKDSAEQGARVILPLQVLAQFTRQCALGAVSNHFDRINEVLALRTKLSVPLSLRQVFEWHFALDLLALISEALQQRRLDLDLLPQLSAFLLKGLELLGRGLRQQN